MTLDIEIRTASLGPVELREGGQGIGQLSGYAAVFNRHSQNLGGFVEQVDPSAFTKSIADAVPVMARMNHDDAHLLGTTWAGTLTLEADGTGLRYTVDLPDTQAGRDAKVLAERGDMKWSSFAFRTIEDAWSQTEQGFPLRTLRAVQLVDVAPVNSPAYLDTTVGLRSLADHQTTEAPAPVIVPEGSGDPHPTTTIRALRLDLDALR
jgi:HK97 family phage prohead protease